jgi:hypothetical protein
MKNVLPRANYLLLFGHSPIFPQCHDPLANEINWLHRSKEFAARGNVTA